GYRRASDGLYVDASGAPIPVAAGSPARTAVNVEETATISDMWSRAGFQGTSDNLPYNAANLNELKASVKGLFFGNNNILPSNYYGAFTTAQVSGENNKFLASNKGGYSNPAYDRLYEAYSTALEPSKRTAAIVALAKMGAD